MNQHLNSARVAQLDRLRKAYSGADELAVAVGDTLAARAVAVGMSRRCGKAAAVSALRALADELEIEP